MRIRRLLLLVLLLAALGWGVFQFALQVANQPYEEWGRVRKSAEEHLSLGHPETALSLLRSADSFDQSEIVVSRALLIAQSCFAMGKGEEGLSVLSQALANLPAEAALINEYGFRLLESQMEEQAESVLATGSKLFPGNPEIAFNLWTARVQRFFKDAAHLKSRLADSRRRDEVQGEVGSLTERIRETLEEHDKNGFARLYGDGKTLIRDFPAGKHRHAFAAFLVDKKLSLSLQRAEEAKTLLRALLKEPGAPAEYLVSLVNLLGKQKETAAAKSLVEEGKKRFPENMPTWTELGLVLDSTDTSAGSNGRTYRLTLKNRPPGPLYVRGGFDADGRPDDVGGWIRRPVASETIEFSLTGPWEYTPKVLFETDSGPLHLLFLPGNPATGPIELDIDFSASLLASVTEYLQEKRKILEQVFVEPLPMPTGPGRVFVLVVDGLFWNYFRPFIEAGLMPGVRTLLAKSTIGALDYGPAPFPFTYIALKTIRTGIRLDDDTMGNLLPETAEQVKGFLQRDLLFFNASFTWGGTDILDLMEKDKIPYVYLSLDKTEVFDGNASRSLDIPTLGEREVPAWIYRTFFNLEGVGLFSRILDFSHIQEARFVLRQSAAFYQAIRATPEGRFFFFWFNESDPFLHRNFFEIQKTFSPQPGSLGSHFAALSLLVVLQLADLLAERIAGSLGPEDHFILMSDHGIKNTIFHHRFGVWCHYSPTNQALSTIAPDMIQVAPTILHLLGVEVPAGMKGKPLR